MNYPVIGIIGIMILLIPFIIKEQKNQIKENKELQRILSLAEENSILLKEINSKPWFYKQKYNDAGVYIFSNLTQNNYKYVGQSINMYNRVHNHTKGHGSPLVYRDIKKGHIFTVNFIKLKDTNFRNLNDLERFYIKEYNSYYNGYNKTRGNK